LLKKLQHLKKKELNIILNMKILYQQFLLTNLQILQD
jgi:hypothetical protein